jgi:hypothetical protein
LCIGLHRRVLECKLRNHETTGLKQGCLVLYHKFCNAVCWRHRNKWGAMNCAPTLVHRSLIGWKARVTGPSQADANHQADDEDDQHDNDKRLWIYRPACAPFCSLPGTKRASEILHSPLCMSNLRLCNNYKRLQGGCRYY